jgi:DNA-binding MarR family transcriptional regulator
MNTNAEQVCEDLLGLIGQMKAVLSRLSEKYGLTVMQVHALYAISQGDSSMGRVAGTLHCDASNVTGIVDRLVASRYIIRQEAEHDRRIKNLALTEKGRNAIFDIYSQLPVRRGCSRLSSDDRTTLHNIVAKMRAGSYGNPEEMVVS